MSQQVICEASGVRLPSAREISRFATGLDSERIAEILEDTSVGVLNPSGVVRRLTRPPVSSIADADRALPIRLRAQGVGDAHYLATYGVTGEGKNAERRWQFALSNWSVGRPDVVVLDAPNGSVSPRTAKLAAAIIGDSMPLAAWEPIDEASQGLFDSDVGQIPILEERIGHLAAFVQLIREEHGQRQGEQ